MKRPAFQFYPADWRKDMALQSCSVAARGLWMDCLCIAHECEPYGHLTVNGNAMTPAQIGRHTGLTARECQALLDELDQAGVLSRTEQGVIFSRRMVRDEASREQRAEIGRQNGAKGAAFGSLGAEHGKKGGRPRTSNPGDEPAQKPPQNPHPSSSSSASAIPSGANAPAAAPPPAPLSAKDRIWAMGVALLGEKGRAFLGKSISSYGEAVLLEVLVQATAEQPVDPKAWLVAACEARGKPKANGKHAEPMTTRDLLDRDPWQPWLEGTGFATIFEAETAGCGPGNADKFRDGRKVA